MRNKIVNEYITYALFDLLKTKELNKITVRELIEKAGVCRSSFYRNYFLLGDIIEKYFEALFDTIFEQYPLKTNNVREHIVGVYTMLLTQKERLAILESRNLLGLLDDALYHVCMQQMENLGIPTDSYRGYFLAGASTSLIRYWIKNNFSKTPEELVDVSFGMFTVNQPSK